MAIYASGSTSILYPQAGQVEAYLKKIRPCIKRRK